MITNFDFNKNLSLIIKSRKQIKLNMYLIYYNITPFNFKTKMKISLLALLAFATSVQSVNITENKEIAETENLV